MATTAKKSTAQKRTAKKTAEKPYEGFTAEERAAMKEHAKELKATTDGETAIREKLAEMTETDRVIAQRIHELVREHAPELTPRLWYGMPAYAKDGSVLCFFQPAAKFKARYPTLGFQDNAALDDGSMWPTSYAITKLTPAVEKQLATLLEKAVS